MTSPFQKVALGVVFSVATTLLFLLVVSSFPGMEITPAYWIVGALCPALVSAPVCLVMVRQMELFRAASLELGVLNQRLMTASTTDYLTGLLNRGEFIRRVEDVRRGPDGWFFLVDVDHFKKVNDTHGHHLGDRALEAVARSLLAVVEPEDLCGRLGGEEFAVFRPIASAAEAAELAEAFRLVVEAMAVHSGTPDKIRITISVGVAPGPDTSTISECLKMADSAMYLAKRRGRNQVQIAS